MLHASDCAGTEADPLVMQKSNLTYVSGRLYQCDE